MAERTALVTGVSRGIGQAIAVALGKQGMTVYGTATGKTGVEVIEQTFSDAGINGSGFILDLSSTESIQNLFSNLPNLPDVLVNNAGITRDGLLLRMTEEDWNAVIQTNLTSLFHICKIASKGMVKARWGRIINITSVSGLMGNAGQCNYAAAKAGVTGFSKTLARELATRNITVNCIAPGFIETDMTASLSEDIRTQVAQMIPLGRFGKPEEIASAAVLLASEAGAYITGETININGGLVMD